MSRRNPSPAETLVLLPWQVSATLAVVAYIGLKWVIPSIGSENKVFAIFIKAGANNAWLAALILGVVAVLSAFMSAKKRALLDAQRGVESLRDLSWKEFEWLVGEAYRRQGYTVEESLGGGADGGIDLIIRKDRQTHLVQCKRWKTQSVGAPIIREQFGLLAHHKADKAIIITSGRFTREAMAFAEGKPIKLIDGTALARMVQSVQTDASPRVAPSSQPDPTTPPSPLATPSCPKCGGTMVERVARKGANTGNTFWGCTSYPQCRGVRNT